MPVGVVRGPEDYLFVDYHRLGPRLQTWETWSVNR